jgi:alpha-L-arabinofuranosidase
MKAGTAFPTPDSYVEHVHAVSQAIRAVDPKARIGIGIDKRSQKWGNYVLKQAAGDYDFVAAHHYASVWDIDSAKFETVALTLNYQALDTCLRVNALLDAYNPDRKVVQLDTEWGLHCSGPNGQRADYVDRNANIFGTIHRAVRLIYYAREGMLAGASSWQMLNRVGAQGFGILAPSEPDKRFMLYWLYYYFNRHLGEQVLAMEGTAPYYTPAAGDSASFKAGQFPGPRTPVLATLSNDAKTLRLVIANGSWSEATPCRIKVRDFAISSVDGVLLTASDPDGKPLLERKEEAISSFAVNRTADTITCTIPPHAVVFLTAR